MYAKLFPFSLISNFSFMKKIIKKVLRNYFMKKIINFPAHFVID